MRATPTEAVAYDGSLLSRAPPKTNTRWCAKSPGVPKALGRGGSPGRPACREGIDNRVPAADRCPKGAAAGWCARRSGGAGRVRQGGSGEQASRQGLVASAGRCRQGLVPIPRPSALEALSAPINSTRATLASCRTALRSTSLPQADGTRMRIFAARKCSPPTPTSPRRAWTRAARRSRVRFAPRSSRSAMCRRSPSGSPGVPQLAKPQTLNRSLGTISRKSSSRSFVAVRTSAQRGREPAREAAPRRVGDRPKRGRLIRNRRPR